MDGRRFCMFCFSCSLIHGRPGLTLKGEITCGLPDEPYGDTVINDVLLGKASSSFPGNARNDVNVELGKLKKTPKLITGR